MPDSSSTNPLDTLAAEFMARLRRGESPSIGEYANRHPDLADEIHDLFPALGFVEAVKPNTQDEAALNAVSVVAPGDQQHPFPVISDYRIFREIGRGGMGIVYEAEHLALGRRVALKVLTAQSDAIAIQRFEQEARAAAAMHHSNIVPVFDVGSSGSHNYYAMQFIVGDGIDQVIAVLADSKRRAKETGKNLASPNSARGEVEIAQSVAITLTKEWSSVEHHPGGPHAGSSGIARVDNDSTQAQADTTAISSLSSPDSAQTYPRNVARIGVEVAGALEHAHRNGIIHRDIKPSNILLDTTGRAWVADFGLAKSASVELTQTGAILGTLRYMSPERFSGPCDKQGDVYGLGATLYEMLSLQPLYRSENHLSLIDCIKTESPKSLRDIDRAIPRDLETIIQKAIEKDPARRYRTASLLRDDLQRYLDGRPILARRVGSFERLGMWAKNNRVIASLAAGLLLTLLVTSVVATIGAIKYRNMATDAKLKAEEAITSAKRSDGALKIVQHAFMSADPTGGADAQMLAKDVLMAAGEQLNESDLDAEGRSRLLGVLGMSLYQLGEYDLAIPLKQEEVKIESRLYGKDHNEVLVSMNDLVVMYGQVGRFEEATAICEEVLAIRKATLGMTHQDTLYSMNSLAQSYVRDGRTEDGLKLHQQVLKSRSTLLGPTHAETIHSMNNVAEAYRVLGKKEEAVALQGRAFAEAKERRGADHPDTLALMGNFALALQESGEVERSLALHEQALELLTAKLGPDHPATLREFNNYADAYQKAGRIQEAEAMYRKAYVAQREKLGPTHVSTLVSMSNLSTVCGLLGNHKEAISLAKQGLDGFQSTLGADHEYTFIAMSRLAETQSYAGHFEEALGTRERVYELEKSAYGRDDTRTVSALNNLASECRSLGLFERSQALFEQCLELRRSSLGSEHRDTLQTMSGLAGLWQSRGDLKTSLDLYRQVVSKQEKLHGPNHRNTHTGQSGLARTLRAMGEYDESLAVFERVLAARQDEFGADHVRTLSTMHALGETLLRAGKTQAAETLLRECHASRMQKSNVQWSCFQTKSVLGECLVANGKLDEAGELLLAGYEGLLERERMIKPAERKEHLGAAIKRLEELSVKKKDSESASKWLARWEELQAS